MPGSGPIDPEIFVNAVKAAGTEWSSNHINVLDGDPPRLVGRWPAVDTGANRWTLSASPACLIDEDTFNALRGCVLRGSIVVSGGLTYTLDSVTVSGQAWAVLQPS